MNNQADLDEVICRCSGTTRQQIMDLIADEVRSLDKISRMTGACSGCGGCEFDVCELLAEAGL